MIKKRCLIFGGELCSGSFLFSAFLFLFAGVLVESVLQVERMFGLKEIGGFSINDDDRQRATPATRSERCYEGRKRKKGEKEGRCAGDAKERREKGEKEART